MFEAKLVFSKMKRLTQFSSQDEKPLPSGARWS